MSHQFTNSGVVVSGQAFDGLSWMLPVLNRAAEKMQAEWPHSLVLSLSWYADGQERPFRACMRWDAADLAPRLVVTDERTGEFFCQSLPGRPYEIDPAVFNVDAGVASDVIARFVDERAASQGQGAAAKRQ